MRPESKPLKQKYTSTLYMHLEITSLTVAAAAAATTTINTAFGFLFNWPTLM